MRCPRSRQRGTRRAVRRSLHRPVHAVHSAFWPMDIQAIKKLSRGRPPAVVLADLALVRPFGMAGIPVILGSGRPKDETLLSRHVRGSFVVPGWTGEHSRSSAEALLQLGAQLRETLGRREIGRASCRERV